MFSTSAYQSMRVIRPTSQFSIASMQITCTTVSFNLSTASELHYPERIVILASDDGMDLAICPWDTTSPVSIENTHPFFDKEVHPVPKRISIKDRRFVQALRKTCGWSGDKLRRVLTAQKKQQKSSLLSIADYPRFSQVAHKMKPMLALPTFGPAQHDVHADYIVY